jgi:hypothetical protein
VTSQKLRTRAALWSLIEIGERLQAAGIMPRAQTQKGPAAHPARPRASACSSGDSVAVKSQLVNSESIPPAAVPRQV